MFAQSRLLDYLSELVSINTVNDPERGLTPNTECANLIIRNLRSEGVEAELLDSSGFYSVVARLGRGKPRLLFMAHYDTVPVNPAEWSKSPFSLSVEGNKAYGRGALDDKANVAALTQTITRLKDSDLQGSVLCALTGDEEIGGMNGARFVKEWLERRGELPDLVVNADGMGLALIVRRRNSFTVKVEIASKPATYRGQLRTLKLETQANGRHAAYFTPGVDSHCLLQASKHFRENPLWHVVGLKGSFLKTNVIPSTCEVDFVEEMRDGEEVISDDALTYMLRALVPLTRVNIPSQFTEFGTTITPNIVSIEAGKIRVKLDVRAMVDNKTSVKTAFESTLSRVLPGSDVTIEGGRGFLSTPTDSPLVEIGLQSLVDLGLPALIIEREGASDSRHFTTSGIPCIDFGPKGGNMHGPDEFVLVDSLQFLPEFYTHLSMKLLSKPFR